MMESAVIALAIFTSTGYAKKYCLLHPWEVIIHKCRDIQCAWQRARKGYCFRDLWNIDYWVLKIMPNMIDEFIEIHYGRPAEITDEEWERECYQIWNSFLRTSHINVLTAYEGKTVL